VRSKLDLSDVLRDMRRTYRSQFGLLLTAALLIFVPLGLIETLARGFESADTSGLSTGAALAVGAVTLIHAATSLLGDVFYSGVVAAAVTRLRRGDARSLGAVARQLRWTRLVAVDLSYDLLLGVALLLLIAPGVLVFGWFSLSAAVVEIEDRGFLDAFRRSRELVRHNFWRVVGLLLPIATLTDLLTSAAESFAESLGHGKLLVEWAGAVAPELLLAPFWGLAAAVLTYELAAIRDTPAH
jgi:Ca2+/Na+ antiporter